MDLFFLPDLIQTDSKIVFHKEESKHIARVMRKTAGDQLQVTNGKGLEMMVELEQIGQSKACKNNPTSSATLSITHCYRTN